MFFTFIYFVYLWINFLFINWLIIIFIYLFLGKFVAAYSNEEESILELESEIPHLTEDKMDECGAICVPGPPG